MPQEAISSMRSSVKAHTSASARSGEECAPPRPALAGLVESRFGLDRRVMPRQISEHVAAALRILAGDDDPGFVGVLARAHRRIDGYDHAHEVGQDKAYRRPCRLDQCPRPQGARYIVEQLALSSWRPRRVPSYFLTICARKAAGKLNRLS
jgi:hypothetical protein